LLIYYPKEFNDAEELFIEGYPYGSSAILDVELSINI
jgi:hypothetical protein